MGLCKLIYKKVEFDHIPFFNIRRISSKKVEFDLKTGIKLLYFEERYKNIFKIRFYCLNQILLFKIKFYLFSRKCFLDVDQIPHFYSKKRYLV